jgi:hypothetical protein
MMVSDKEFVRIYLQSSSIGEVAEKTKLKKLSAQSRARQLRRMGVKLPLFDRHKKVDINELNAIIAEWKKKQKKA